MSDVSSKLGRPVDAAGELRERLIARIGHACGSTGSEPARAAELSGQIARLVRASDSEIVSRFERVAALTRTSNEEFVSQLERVAALVSRRDGRRPGNG